MIDLVNYTGYPGGVNGGYRPPKPHFPAIFFQKPLDSFFIFWYFLVCTILLFSEGDFYALMRRVLTARLVQEPGWFSNKSYKILRILLFFSGSYSKTEVSE